MSAIPLTPEPGLPGAVPPSAAAPGARAERREGQRVRRWYNQPALMIGIGITAIVLAAAIAGPLISPYDPNAQNLNATLLGPSAHHLLGTDQLGRDVFTRLLYGTRLDLRIAFIAVLFPFTLGITLGSLAGYFGGWIDTVIMRVVDVVLAFPFYVLLIALVFVLGPGERSIYIAITLVGWVSYARIIRGEILVAKRQDYILAAQAGGLGSVRIMRRHLLPNVITQVPGLAISGRELVKVTALSACSASSSAAVGGVRLGWVLPGAPTIAIRTTATSWNDEALSHEAWARKR